MNRVMILSGNAVTAVMEVPSRKTYADILEGCTALLKSL